MKPSQQRPLFAARSVSSRRIFAWVMLLALACGLSFDSRSVAATRVYDPDVVKAGLVAQLMRFVEWPESARGPRPPVIEVVFLGESPIENALARMQLPELRIRHVRRVSDIGQSHVVFVTRSFDSSLVATLDAVEGRPVLVIADGPSAAARGATVGLRDDGTRIRIDVNRAALVRSRLRLSYHVLRLATVVEEQ